MMGNFDIGTVTCRLLVANVSASGDIDELRRETIICNLGVGVDKTGLLAPESIERVGQAIEGFVAILRELQPEGENPIPVRAVATSASRDAKNASRSRNCAGHSGSGHRMKTPSGSRRSSEPQLGQVFGNSKGVGGFFESR